MNINDEIEKLMLEIEDINSLLDIMEKIIFELEKKITNSETKSKIVGEFIIIWKIMLNKSKLVDKGLNSLFHLVFEIEKNLKK